MELLVVLLGLASHWIAGPFSWIRSGKVDVHVDDEWKHGDTIMVDCHWRLVLTDIVAEVPAGLGLVQGGAAKLAVAWLNERDKPLEIEFDLTLDEQSFEGVAALAQTELVEKVASAVRKTLAKVLGK